MTAAPDPPRRNRLGRETSPYLRQHADNPVDWYPWGEEAFERARSEGKPLLLSVGYSSCHWCHVMAHESFENEATAELMNRWFVNVKVDREERPDVDSVYMAAVQALTGQGGWPMTVFLTPAGEPFYAGTYFPPADGHGRPGFPRLLEGVARAWETDRENVTQSAAKVTEHLRALAAQDLGGELELSPELPAAAARSFAASFDRAFGGFGGAPKFPSPGNLEFLLAHGARVRAADPEDVEPVAMALHTLTAMATGGIYDQLGGGFARYSVDQAWVVPHFEKMLYDNAQLVRVYLHALQLTGDPLFERISSETVDYMLRELRDEGGGFFSAEDADSEGIEGKFYVWSLGEVERLLGREAAFASACFGVTGAGNFLDPHHPEFGSRNVLTLRFDPKAVSARFDVPVEGIEERLAPLRRRMLEERATRTRPGLDDKVLASWNGLALAALAEAGRVLGNPEYVAAAAANASFLREQMWRDGRLLHSWKDGEARIAGMLEDYAYVGLGLVELFKATGDLAHLAWARDLLEVIVSRFAAGDGRGFFDTAVDSEELLVRQKDFLDQATPSGNGAASLLALWLARYFDDSRLEELALRTVASATAALTRHPAGFGTLWQAVEFLLSEPTELVISGDARARGPFEQEVAYHYLPWVALAPTADGQGLPMFDGREPNGGARAYLCRDMVCELPADSPGELEAQLDALAQRPSTASD